LSGFPSSADACPSIDKPVLRGLVLRREAEVALIEA
jgi:GH24 family phage-related lysozyme (muramidase)